jgi:hypothetical protein
MGSARGQLLNDPICVSRTEIEVSEGNVPLYMISWPEPPLPTTPVTQRDVCDLRIVDGGLMQWSLIAVLDRGDAIVDVRFDVGGYFESLEAMKEILTAVRRR